MRGARAGADAPLLGGLKWLPWGPPFAMHKAGGWKHNAGIQVLWDLTTVARQTGRDSGECPKTVTCVSCKVFLLSSAASCV